MRSVAFPSNSACARVAGNVITSFVITLQRIGHNKHPMRRRSFGACDNVEMPAEVRARYAHWTPGHLRIVDQRRGWPRPRLRGDLSTPSPVGSSAAKWPGILNASIPGTADALNARRRSSGSRGTKPSTPSPRTSNASRPPTDLSPSCPTATPAPWACSTVPAWTVGSFTAWEPPASIAPSAPPPGAPRSTPRSGCATGRNPNSFDTLASSSPGARTFLERMFTCGPSF
jgi:hypothetical protein